MRVAIPCWLILLAACGGDERDLSSSPDSPAPAPAVAARPVRSEAGSALGASWRSDDGVLASELPRGWTIAAAEPGRVLVNPGLKQTDKLDCLLAVVWGELDASQRGLDAVATMEAHDEELRAELKAQQVDLRTPKERPARVDVGGFDGAERMYEGKAAGNSVRTWVGTTLQDGWHATVVAVVVAGREDAFLPGARTMLAAARLSAPKRDAQLEARLAGAEFGGSTSFGGGGSIETVYRFERGGAVLRTALVSGSFGIDGATGGESKKRGSWTTSGSTLRMRFEDGVEEAQLELRGSKVQALVVGRLRCTRL